MKSRRTRKGRECQPSRGFGAMWLADAIVTFPKKIRSVDKNNSIFTVARSLSLYHEGRAEQ